MVVMNVMVVMVIMVVVVFMVIMVVTCHGLVMVQGWCIGVQNKITPPPSEFQNSMFLPLKKKSFMGGIVGGCQQTPCIESAPYFNQTRTKTSIDLQLYRGVKREKKKGEKS